MATTVLKKGGEVRIPPEIQDELALEGGEVFDVTAAEDGSIVLRPQEETAERHPAIDAELAAALEEVRLGKTLGPFESVEEMKTHFRTHPGHED